MSSLPASLIGLDWGSTQVRAFLFDGRGQIRQSMQAPLGVGSHPATAGVAAVAQWLAPWLDAHPTVPVLACGMVGSQNGWQTVPYLPTPLSTQQLGAHLTRLEAWGRDVFIVPGVCHDSAQDGFTDVMRGEETQIAGLAAAYPELPLPDVIMTPGTHNKWIRLSQGGLQSLATFMTGEIYALLREHSLIAPVIADGPFEAAHFLAGVDTARQKGDWLHQLFGIRARGVQQLLPPAALNQRLSGLLIGYEIHSALASQTDTPIRRCGLIGSPGLTRLYATALQHFGIEAIRLDGDRAVTAGLWSIARHAGLHQSLAAHPLQES